MQAIIYQLSYQGSPIYVIYYWSIHVITNTLIVSISWLLCKSAMNVRVQLSLQDNRIGYLLIFVICYHTVGYVPRSEIVGRYNSSNFFRNSHTEFHMVIPICCCSVAKSCPTLCNPMDCSTPGSSVLNCLLEFAQIHVHWVSDAV